MNNSCLKDKLTDITNQAFLQLEFSIKLMDYIELGGINVELGNNDEIKFDTNALIQYGHGTIRFPSGNFGTKGDLICASINNFNIILGFTAITLDASLKKAGFKNNSNGQAPNDKLCTLVYMIRCAYAHDMMHPKWEVKKKFQKPLTIELKGRTIDLDFSQKNGQCFDINDIGGHLAYFDIKDEVINMIKSATER